MALTGMMISMYIRTNDIWKFFNSTIEN